MKRKVRLSMDEQLVLLALDDSMGPKAARIRAKWPNLSFLCRNCVKSWCNGCAGP